MHDVRIRASELTPGDLIVLTRDRMGVPRKTLLVQRLEHGESCKGIHVNVKRAAVRRGTPVQEAHDRATIAHMMLSSDGCYDLTAFLDVLRTEAVLSDT